MVLRIPTSLALFSEFAVVKFIKLIQASNNMKRPIIPNIHTYSMRPPVYTPLLNSEYKCHLSIECRKSEILKDVLDCPEGGGAKFFMIRFSIRADTCATSACGNNWTNICQALLIQKFAASLGRLVMYKSHGAINVTSLKVVLLGKSW